MLDLFSGLYFEGGDADLIELGEGVEGVEEGGGAGSVFLLPFFDSAEAEVDVVEVVFLVDEEEVIHILKL